MYHVAGVMMYSRFFSSEYEPSRSGGNWPSLCRSPAARILSLAALLGSAQSVDVAAATLTFYTDRPTFQTAAGTLVTETFEGGNVAAAGTTACSAIYDATTTDACWNPNHVLDGFAVLSANGLSIWGAGYASNTSVVTGTTLGDPLEIGFFGNFSVGMDVIYMRGSTVGTFDVYANDYSTLLGSVPSTTAPFFGVISDTPIGAILISSTTPSLSPVVDNVSFEQIPDLAISATGSENPAGIVTFTVTVQNLGPIDATNVVATLAIPSGLAYVSDDCSGSNATAPWTWTIGGLTNGAQLTCHVTTNVLQVQTAYAAANVQGSHPVESDMTNNHSVAVVPVIGAGPNTPDSGFALFRPFYEMGYVDQDGLPFSLRANADKVILLQTCAGWCGACQVWADASSSLKQTVDLQIGAGHFLDVDMLVQNNTFVTATASYEPSSQADAADWKTNHNFVGPVLHSEGSVTSPLYQMSIDLAVQYNAVPAQEYFPEFFLLAPDCNNQIVVRALPAGGAITVPPLSEQALVDTTSVTAMANLITDVWNQRPCAKPLVHRIDRCSVGAAPIYSLAGSTDAEEAAVPFTVAVGDQFDIASVTAVTDAPVIDFNVYADASGIPGGGVCASMGRSAAPMFAPNVRKIELDARCQLGPGNYWMALRGRDDNNSTFVPNWLGGRLPAPQGYLWRDPNNTSGNNCPTWDSACVANQATTNPCFMIEADPDVVFRNSFELP